jgi:hypothetical protein
MQAVFSRCERANSIAEFQLNNRAGFGNNVSPAELLHESKM